VSALELSASLVSGEAACLKVIERALDAECWSKLGGSFQVVGDLAARDLRKAFVERAERLSSLLTDFGFGTAFCTRSSPPDVYEASDLEDVDRDTWIRCAYAFERAIEIHQEETRRSMPMLWHLHDALEQMEVLWLDALKCVKGCFPLWWMAEESRKLNAFRALRDMGIHDEGEGGVLLIRTLRKSSGEELISSAGKLLGALQSRGPEFRQEWGSVYDLTSYVLGQIVMETAIDVSPEERAEGLDDIRELLSSLGMEEAAMEGNVFPLRSLREGEDGLPDAVKAWLAHVSAEKDAATRELHAAGLVDPNIVSEDHPLLTLLQCAGMLLAIDRSLRDSAFFEVVAALEAPPRPEQEVDDEIPFDLDLVSSEATANLTTAPKTCQEEGSATEEGTGAIDDASPAIETELEPREAFASAVSDAREAVQVVATTLQRRLDEARRFLPTEQADKEELAEAVREARKLGLKIMIDGREASKLALKRGITLTWQMLDKGNLGFRKNLVTVVGRPAPAQAGAELTPK